MIFLEVKNIAFSYGRKEIVRPTDFSLSLHSFMSILGASGSGKTSLLKIIAGLLVPKQGNIFLDSVDITSMPASKRKIVYLYQEPLLFPHLNVFENIAFGLRIRKINKTLVNSQVQDMIEELGLLGHENKMPEELSGGQKQRVNFGRALIIKPGLLLLDEPFGSLDTYTRTNMQKFYLKIAREHKITSIFVTHDLKEALLMGETIASMNEGSLKVYGSREEFINDPDSGIGEEREFWETLKISRE